MDIQSQDNRIKKSVKFSFWDGVFANGMAGFTQEHFAPFLLISGATTRHIALLNALPNLFSSLTQLTSANLVEKVRSRRKIITIFVFLQAIMLIPMAVAAVMGGITPFFFIMIVTVFTLFGAITTPIYGSLLSDMIDDRKRGVYFGWRNKVLGIVALAATFIAGAVLHLLKKWNNIFFGFAAVFIAAFIFRMVSWRFLTKMYDPPVSYNKADAFTLFSFLARVKESNFAKFVLFVSAMNFSVNIASPFFSVFMLRDLHFSYLLYTAITVTAPLVVYLTVGRWGREAVTAPFIGLVPFLWLFNHHPAYLFLAQVFSGFVWAGFNIAASNFIYDAVSPPKRTRCIAYFNVLNGCALFGGAIMGGFFLRALPDLFGYNILTLFFVSSFLRAFVGLYLPKKLKEVRVVEKIGASELFFQVLGIKPLIGVKRKTI